MSKKEYDRLYYESYKEKIKKRNRQYRLNNLDKINFYSKLYRLKNKEKLKILDKKYYLAHKSKWIGLWKKQRAKDPKKYAVMSNKRVKKYYRKNQNIILNKDIKKRVLIVNFLGGKCVKCGYSTDVRALQLDHKNGDGYLDRKKLGTKISRYYSKRLDEAKEKLQVLCANCNIIKALENKEHNKSRRIKILE